MISNFLIFWWQVKDRQYFYVGRTDRTVKILGHKVNLMSIDAELSAHSFVKHSYSVFSPKEDICIIFVVPVDDNIAADQLENLIKFPFPNKIFKVTRIPLNEHGT